MTQLVQTGSPLERLYRRVQQAEVARLKDTPEATPVRETKAMRMAKWQKPVAEMDQKELADLEALLESFVQEKFAKTHVTEVRTLSQDEIDQMASEYKDLLVIESMVQARKDDMKRMTFTHINVEHADDDGPTPPELAKGALVSEKEGIAFKREGGNLGDPTIDWPGLFKVLTAEQWSQILDVEEIPATSIETPSQDKLLALVDKGEVDIETLRPFVLPGKPSPVKFVPRPIK